MKGRSAFAGGAATVGILGLLAACSDTTQPPVPAHQFRLSFSGAQSGTSDIVGAPALPLDPARDVVLLSNGVDNGVAIPYQVYANRATSMVEQSGRDQIILYLNPNVTHPGEYPAGACPEPAAVAGCFDLYASFGLPQAGGTPASLLRSVGGGVTLSVEEFTPTRIRARFSGQFTLAPSGQQAIPVTVTNGFVDAVRVTGP